MIQSFKSKPLKLYFEKGDSSKIRPDLLRRVGTILTQLQGSKNIKDMNAPALGLHELKGERKGTWSVTVKANWRITFRFVDEDCYDVDLEDYH